MTTTRATLAPYVLVPNSVMAVQWDGTEAMANDLMAYVQAANEANVFMSHTAEYLPEHWGDSDNPIPGLKINFMTLKPGDWFVISIPVGSNGFIGAATFLSYSDEHFKQIFTSYIPPQSNPMFAGDIPRIPTFNAAAEVNPGMRDM